MDQRSRSEKLARSGTNERKQSVCGAFLGVALLMNGIITASGAAPFQKILLHAEKGISVPAIEITRKDVPEASGNWFVRKTTLVGGKQEGVELITVNNGKLQFTVIPTRGMSVLRVEMGAVRLGWNSPLKEVVHPKFINLQSRGGLGWLE